MNRLSCPLLVACCALAVAGCGPRGVYPVEGKVLYKGSPAVGAVVSFVPRDSAARAASHTAQGVVGDDGRSPK